MSVFDEFGIWDDNKEVINPQAAQPQQPRQLQVEPLKNNQLPYQPAVPLENLVQPVQDFPEGSQQWEQKISDQMGIWGDELIHDTPYNPELPDVRSEMFIRPFGESKIKGSRVSGLDSMLSALKTIVFNNPADRVEAIKTFMGENYVGTKIDDDGNVIVTARDGKGDNQDYFVDAPNFSSKDWTNTFSRIANDIPSFGSTFLQSLPAMKSAQVARGVFPAAKLATSGLARFGQASAALGAAGGTELAVNYVVQDILNGRTTPSKDTLITSALAGGSEIIGPLYKFLSTNPKLLAVAGTLGTGVDLSPMGIVSEAIQGGVAEGVAEGFGKKALDWISSGLKTVAYKTANIGKNTKIADEVFEVLSKTEDGRNSLMQIMGEEAFNASNSKQLFSSFLDKNIVNVSRVSEQMANIPTRYRKMIADAAEEVLTNIENSDPLLASYISKNKENYNLLKKELSVDPKLTKKWNELYGRDLTSNETGAVTEMLIDNGYLPSDFRKSLRTPEMDYNLELYNELNKAQNIINSNAGNRNQMIAKLKREGYKVANEEDLDTFINTHKTARQHAENILNRKISLDIGSNPFIQGDFNLSEKLFKTDLSNKAQLEELKKFKSTISELPNGKKFLQKTANKKLLNIVDTSKTTEELASKLDEMFNTYAELMLNTKEGDAMVHNVGKFKSYLKSISKTKSESGITPTIEPKTRGILQILDPTEGIFSSKLYSKERKSLFDALTMSTYDLTVKYGSAQEKANALANIIRYRRLSQLDDIDAFGRNALKYVSENKDFYSSNEKRKQLEDRLRNPVKEPEFPKQDNKGFRGLLSL